MRADIDRLKKNILDLESISGYYEDLIRDNKTSKKAFFKRRFLAEKILDICVKNKKILDDIPSGPSKR